MKNVTIYFLLIKIIILFSVTAQGQLHRPDSTKWDEGTVTLADGKTISGLLKLNTRTGLLAYEDKSISRSLTPAKVMAFEFFDHRQNKIRNFITVNYNSIDRFFEVLLELKTFAVLSSFEKLEALTLKGSTPPAGGGINPLTNRVEPVHQVGPQTTTTTTFYSQTETLFIFDQDGNITPILDVTNSQKNKVIENPKDSWITKEKEKTKNKTKTPTKRIDNKTIEKYTFPHFEKLELYAEENDLRFKEKDDLLRILEYYKKLESN